jgi:hypothetical protein
MSGTVRLHGALRADTLVGIHPEVLSADPSGSGSQSKGGALCACCHLPRRMPGYRCSAASTRLLRFPLLGRWMSRSLNAPWTTRSMLSCKTTSAATARLPLRCTIASATRHSATLAAQRVQEAGAASTGSGATRVLGLIEHGRPEDHAVADDFLRRLRTKFGPDARAAAVLEGMLKEMPPTLISSTSDVSLRAVERLRPSIRATAAELALA